MAEISLNQKIFDLSTKVSVVTLDSYCEMHQINKVDFNFNRCENNINLFKKELRNDEIVYIEKKLKKYLYPF